MMKKITDEDVKGKKLILSKSMSLSKQPSGELSDDELGEVAGGSVTQCVAKAFCPVCGYMSDFYDPFEMPDIAIVDRRHKEYKGCANEEFRIEYYR